MIRNLIKLRQARRQFRRTLALNTPLIDGAETRRVCRLIRYNPDKAIEIANGLVPFDPRPTYPRRLIEHLKKARSDG